MKTGIELIAEERQRQIEKEGWTSEHDATHQQGELADAAACYALTDDALIDMDYSWGNDMYLRLWPFDLKWLKRDKNNRIRDLQKAGALIAAEIDRLQLKTEEVKECNCKCWDCDYCYHRMIAESKGEGYFLTEEEYAQLKANNSLEELEKWANTHYNVATKLNKPFVYQDELLNKIAELKTKQ